MKITRTLWDDGGNDPLCPNGVDCEKTYDTDAGGKLVRINRSRVVNPAAVGLQLPEHEMLFFVPDEQWNGGRA